MTSEIRVSTKKGYFLYACSVPECILDWSRNLCTITAFDDIAQVSLQVAFIEYIKEKVVLF